eukprot:TRINITY_DN10661_c0_g1_i1.p1 TRINITY_DN10661_c0_g1~~TRINITY_DN10661_c0_g1_i1.p1  ORF type:complete len:134 (-),score=17.43 TRINITY_DN10661_c0_g1_i1:28-429(-)
MTYFTKKMNTSKGSKQYITQALNQNLRICKNPNPTQREIWDTPHVVFPNFDEIRDTILVPHFESLQKKYENEYPFLILWFAMECALSRIVESFLVLDRFLYMEEHPNVLSSIIPIFDKKLSPRNLALVSKKKE